MKMIRIIPIVFLIFALCITGLEAQPLRGMSLNGSTGLYSIPTGRTGWEGTSALGLDLGYHAIIRNGNATHIPKASLSLFKWVEVSAGFDFQTERHRRNGNDFLGGLKVQFPLTKTALSLGGNLQSLNLGNSSPARYNAGQVYLAVTYAGTFFEMPAETTVVLGKTFSRRHSNLDFDFGMGLDLLIFPKIFNRYLHWIVDFSNFSYSVEAWDADSWNRGVLNTGIRVDLSAIPIFKKFKFALDILVTDLLDANRAFSVGAVFGVPIF